MDSDNRFVNCIEQTWSNLCEISVRFVWDISYLLQVDIPIPFIIADNKFEWIPGFLYIVFYI